MATPLLIGFAPVVWRLATGLTVPAARMVGYIAAMTAVGGMAVGALHLIGTDTVTRTPGVGRLTETPTMADDVALTSGD